GTRHSQIATPHSTTEEKHNGTHLPQDQETGKEHSRQRLEVGCELHPQVRTPVDQQSGARDPASVQGDELASLRLIRLGQQTDRRRISSAVSSSLSEDTDTRIDKGTIMELMRITDTLGYGPGHFDVFESETGNWYWSYRNGGMVSRHK